MEEAQQIAQEFVATLDNLPAEIKFIMEEIKLKEQEAADLQNTVNRKILKANPRPSGGHSRDANLMERIQPDLDRIDQLSKAKVELAQHLVLLMTRTCGRLDYDLNRVRRASGELPPIVEPVQPIFRAVERPVDVVKTPIAIPESAPSPPSSVIGPSQFKRRRMGSTNVGTVSNTPITLSQVVPPPRNSRLSNAFNARSPPPSASRRGAPSRPPHSDATGEETEDTEEQADSEDKQLYCFCRKLSYGEMVGCDNPSCHYQWFHLNCVGLKPPLPENWFCSECTRVLGAAADTSGQGNPSQGGERVGRKGRKK